MDIQPLEIKEKFHEGIKNNSELLANGVKRVICWGSSGSGKNLFCL